jgi:ABC-2 type transport system ATP-binding protein
VTISAGRAGSAVERILPAPSDRTNCTRWSSATLSGPPALEESSMVAPVVRVRGVIHDFGPVRALDGIDLDVPAGVVYGLLGPNGAGKTTLIRVLSTLLRPTAGQVEVAGVDVLADATAARARIGLAGQFAAVDAYLTGRENVEMVGRLYGFRGREVRRRSDEVLERIGLASDADRRVSTYSGGMRRRLDLAASLVGRPEVMFLDEPTTGIDPRSRMDVWELIAELVATGTTVLLTTQYLEEADRLADHIAIIDLGRIVSQGTADELKARVASAVLEVRVPDADRAAAMRILEGVVGQVPTSDAAGVMLRVPARDGTGTLVAVVRALDEAGLAPDDVTLQRPSLDDVFLAVTGQPVASSASEADAAEGAGPAPGGRGGRRRARSRR